MRKILIIPNGTIEQHQQMAEEKGISEIADGIPPIFADQYTNDDLPVIHEEEPSPPPEPTPIERLEEENKLLKAQNQALSEQADFHEDVLTEIILEMYS